MSCKSTYPVLLALGVVLWPFAAEAPFPTSWHGSTYACHLASSWVSRWRGPRPISRPTFFTKWESWSCGIKLLRLKISPKFEMKKRLSVILGKTGAFSQLIYSVISKKMFQTVRELSSRWRSGVILSPVTQGLVPAHDAFFLFFLFLSLQRLLRQTFPQLLSFYGLLHAVSITLLQSNPVFIALI